MRKYKNRLIFSAASFMLFGGIIWLLTDVFLSGKASLRLPCLAVGAAVILSCGLTDGKAKRIISILWLIAVTVFVSLLHAKIADGIAGAFNGIIDAYKRAYPKNYDVFTARDPQNILYFLIPVSALSSLGFRRSIERHARAFCLPLLFLTVIMLTVFLPILSSVQTAAAVLLCLFSLILSLSHCKSSCTAFFGAWLRTAAMLILVSSMLLGLFGANRPPLAVKGEEHIRQSVEALRYGGTDGTGLTDGDLSRVGPRQSSSETMMKVTMSAPGSCYLRGFVGDVYDGGRWRSLPNTKLYESADSFAFLHQNGFYAQTQLSSAAASADEKYQSEANIIQIENIGLPSSRLYVPCGLAERSALLDPRSIGDSTVNADGLRGIRSYTVTEDSSLVLDYQKTLSLLLQNREKEAVKEYLGYEAVYNRFIYENYTALPADIDSYLFGKLGSYAKQDGEQHFDYSSAKQNILYYLTNTLDYDEAVTRTDDGIDFILNFLEGTKRGYDVHYASAAVMMFRYYGIPARFAEGYIVTSEDAENAGSGIPVSLDASRAHAWAEYYQDGIGWIPFEAAPNYLSVMDQPDAYRNISGLIGQTSENEHTEALQPEEPDIEEQPTLLSFWLKNRLTIILILAVAAASLLLILFILWLIRERRKTAARKALFLSDDLRLAVCTAFEYTADIMAAGKIPIDNRPAEEYAALLDEDLREMYLRAVAVRQEAVFSRNEMTEEQRGAVLSLKDAMWDRLWKNAGALKKLQIKFMYFL